MDISLNEIESWWKHNGCWDRAQASGIDYHGQDNYLAITDEWWSSLTNEQIISIYQNFFNEE